MVAMDDGLGEGSGGREAKTDDDGVADRGLDEELRARIASEFNFLEFFMLATRVIDEGDRTSMAALEELKEKWIQKVGTLKTQLIPMNRVGLRPVLARRPTPFHSVPPLRPPWRALRIPMGDQLEALSCRLLPWRVWRLGFWMMKLGLLRAGRLRPADSSQALTGLFIGNIPLYTSASLNTDDKFAAAFDNSSHKMLSFVLPTIQNGKIIVRPSLELVREGSRKWVATAVGYFLGKKPYFHHLNEYVHSAWPLVKEVIATTNDFFFFKFKTVAAMEEVIEGGPWLFQGQPIILQRWEPGLALRKHKHTQVPIWIKLRHLLVEFWTTEGLSMVASGIGRPLYPDAITKACTRLDFARVYIMLDISSKLPKHLIIMIPREDGGESPCRVEVKYEWVPPKCRSCNSLGHQTDKCPSTQIPKKPPISVYVQKPMAGQPKAMPERTMEYAPEAAPLTAPPHDREDEERSHTVHMGTKVQPYGMFVDLTAGIIWRRLSYLIIGNDLWIIWGLEHVFGLHGSMMRANDVYEWRELWRSLVQLADSISDEPWLVMGDFNMVVDMSEVCGISGDIHVTMEEFQDCLSHTGLLTLPMQGNLYIWHNCSTGPRSLWKQLDRILVNDRWLDRWPEVSYSSLSPRTSDHSPLVLRGDLHHTPIRFFHFDNYLTASPDFIPTVHNIWRHHHVVGTALYSVTQKLKALKPKFRQQRKKKGDLSPNVKLAKEYLDIAQDLLR
ncbi:UNVERIFIED_CONTAM: hypothetical protein Slati_3901900 [Sesamum latifolium]|uniref:DUF4283 domain-containing protein n=1 Tax=Sesamum latifolium TaxID=2727402 RepID=A0AAW2TLN6_9LAMI